MSDPLVELHAAVDALLSQDPTGVPESVHVVRLESLLALESKVRALQAAWLSAADTADATVAECGRTTRSWLVEEQMLAPGEASRRMRLARGLGDAPSVFTSFAAGDITAEHALLILKVLPHADDSELRTVVEDTLVELSRQRPPFLVARAVDEVLLMLGAETSSAGAHERRFGERGVGIDETLGGTGSLNGTLTPEVREKLRLALDTAGVSAGPDDDRTQRQRMHDALGEIADFYLSRADMPAVNGERPRVMVTLDFDTLLGSLEDSWATLGAGTPLAPETARRLACDAEILPVVLDGKSDVLDIGRASRTWTAAIRRAAWLRDGGRCTYPGCTRPPAELHHIVWWSLGGHTSLDNSAWLCAFHHWLVHEGRWALHRDPDGTLVFTAGDGRTRSSPRHPQAA